jgi:dolichol kinase
MNPVLRDEVKRKCFHLLMLIYVFVFWYFEKTIVIVGLSAAIFVVASLEFLRFKVPSCNQFFTKNFSGFYRPEEANKVSGLIGTLLGALIAILLFGEHYKIFVLASFLYLAFGDSSAALIGRAFGKHKMPTGKSYEGSCACFIACALVGLFLFNLWFALIGALIATLIELIPWKINDNFWMQIVNAGLLILLSQVLAWL